MFFSWWGCYLAAMFSGSELLRYRYVFQGGAATLLLNFQGGVATFMLRFQGAVAALLQRFQGRNCHVTAMFSGSACYVTATPPALFVFRVGLLCYCYVVRVGPTGWGCCVTAMSSGSGCYVPAIIICFQGFQDCKRSSEQCSCTEKHVPTESCELAVQIAMTQRSCRG